MQPRNVPVGQIRTGIALAYYLQVPLVLAGLGQLSAARLLVILTVAVGEALRRRFLPHPGMAAAVAGLALGVAVADPVLIALAPAAALAAGSSGRTTAASLASGPAAVVGILAAVAAIAVSEFGLPVLGDYGVVEAVEGSGVTRAAVVGPGHTAVAAGFDGSAGAPATALLFRLYRTAGLAVLAAALGLSEFLLVRLGESQTAARDLQDDQQHLLHLLGQRDLQMQQARDALTGRIELTERNRIARTLHDALGHGLTGALWQLRAADQLLSHGETDPAGESLRRGIAAVDDGLAAIRATVQDLRPREVPDLLLLRKLVEEFRYCPAALQFSGDPARIPGGVLAVFCDNLRELLTNTMRHSQASQVQITVSHSPGFSRLEYRDNGVGLPRSGPAAAEHRGMRDAGGAVSTPGRAPQPGVLRVPGSGMGLDGIRTRTEAIGGRCSFGSDSSRGFVCVCLVQGGTE
ncbi:sensor histidine kinase [Spirochaeta africana]|uniref:histidine kinase n=1 Tax=Spirochaeta africana (strain ATCC 700263 / DSM 8902 / Z-7692) TaxID=889378 RepID=H9UG88_SPIAZ|nr:histidine kinase [Spirochaeta africana]AFG36531.1 histidine kinase [Spirochaeta africana DSM 8902]